ncbi:MAG TPA: S41 family peptidase [Pseudosphingobacterium sp.]|nr:S41 family peptidase [Pseudosphingobacterium sp.]
MKNRVGILKRSIGVLTYAVFLLIVLVSCKKEEKGLIDELVSPTTGTRMEFTLDSVFLYAKQVYLWQEGLPSYADFDPRARYGTINPELTAYKTELYDISQMNSNPQTGNSYELPVYEGSPKYSYLEQETTKSSTVNKASISTISSETILKNDIITIGSKNVGYIALGSFPLLANIKSELDNIFSGYVSAEISDIIVDLRSNGGGYVETAEYMANLIAPSRLTGHVMYSEQFNSLMQSGKATILKNQLYRDANGNTVMHNGRLATMADVDFSKNANTVFFNKVGQLESIQHVYFIVSGNTASASELLISSLKPYFDVKLIGEKTYGKPIGFFGIHIDSYTVYLSSFILQNAAGWHDYFEGMQPNVTLTFSADISLGNLDEPGLYAALTLIKSSSTLSSFTNLKSFTDTRREYLNNQNQPIIQKPHSENYVPIYKQQFKLK